MAQAAKRIIERENISSNVKENIGNTHPKLLTTHQGKYCKIQFEKFVLASNTKDSWFLTKNCEVVSMQSAKLNGSEIQMHGKVCKKLEDFFKSPFSSHFINIYQADVDFSCTEKFFKITDVKCKMIALKGLNGKYVFMPLLHTL